MNCNILKQHLLKLELHREKNVFMYIYTFYVSCQNQKNVENYEP